MTPLALLLLGQRSTGQYTPAALASAAYALSGAAASPVAGRLADRYGAAPLLLITAVIHPVALIVLVDTATRHLTFWSVLVGSAVAGAGYPPLTAAVRVAGFPALVTAAGGLGCAFGVCAVAVPAFANAHAPAARGLGGFLLAIWGVGSMAGGVVFASMSFGRPLARQFPWLLGALAVSMVVLAAMPNPVALGVALTLGGATIAPVLTVQNSLVGLVTPAS